jgi:hypothetical protein
VRDRRAGEFGGGRRRLQRRGLSGRDAKCRKEVEEDLDRWTPILDAFASELARQAR